MTANTRTPAVIASYADLQTVAEVVIARFPSGPAEADRAAHVRQLLDVTADLNYAISTYTHGVVGFAGRRPAGGDLRDETVALQEALEAFGAHVRAIADAYRDSVTLPLMR